MNCCSKEGCGFTWSMATGFPTAREEEWRFTPVTPIARTSWRPAVGISEEIPREQIAPFIFGHEEWSTLVFVNGEYAPGLSSPGSLPAGVVATSLSEALRNGGDVLQRHFAKYARIEENPFTALNTALFRDGGFVHVSPGVDLPVAINLVFVSTADAAGTVTHPRNLIVVERSRREAPISFWEYFRVGAPLTVVTIAFGSWWLSF